MNKLNLGCGKEILPGFINADRENFPGVNKIIDLNKFPYPFKDNQFNHIVMKNILEHLDNPERVLKEIHRISKPLALIDIRVPHFSSNNVWGDIQHKRGFSSQTFLNDNLNKMFRVIIQEITFSHLKFPISIFALIFPLFYEKHLAYIFNAVDIILDLEVIK